MAISRPIFIKFESIIPINIIANISNDSFGKYTYVVGHTTTDDIVFTRQESLDSYLAGYFDDTCPPDQNTIKMIEEANDVITCDTLGKGIYLVVEDGKFIPTKFEK